MNAGVRRAITSGRLLLALLATGCAPGTATVPPDSTNESVLTARVSATATADAAIVGSFDVGGYSLYLECHGSRAPTVIYLHGYATEQADAREWWGSVPDFLGDGRRACTYDRANVGRSNTVPGLRTGSDSVRELHALLEAAAVPGPYILYGGSFGGLIAYMYAVEYPAEVAGMVLVDPALPGDYRFLDLVPEDELAEAIPDFNRTTERIDDPATSREAEELTNPVPAIPMTLISPEELELPASWPIEEITTLVRALQRDLVDRFAPGKLVFADAPHYMEPVIPERIAAEIEAVIELAEAN